MKPKNMDEDDIDEDDDTYDAELEDRTKDYGDLKYVRKQLGELYAAVETGFADKKEQNDTIEECWDIYNCILNEHQKYYGTSEVYVPIVRDAMAARETRFINTLFPQVGRYADVVGDGKRVPYDLIALLDYYVRRSGLRKRVAPAMIRTGDISGSYALYMDWLETERHVTSKTKVKEMKTELGTDIEGSPEYDDIDHEKTIDQRVGITVLDPRNLCILPVTAEGVEDADVVAIQMRVTKSKIKHWIKEGIIEKKPGEDLIRNMNTQVSAPLPDTGKQSAAAAGIKMNSKGSKTALVFRVWSKLKIRGETRLMVTHFAGPDNILGCKRNPYWCDRVPVIMQPVEPQADTVWGPSQVAPVAAIQYEANDAVAKGFDSASYALLPIVMTDPEKNPRAGSMILAMASIWLCDPASTQFAKFPEVWKDAFALVGSCKEQIFQSLGVNPAMIPHGNAGKKPSQAQIAQEQQVALESTADNITLVQEGIFSEVLEWMYELDYQYRTEAITVKKFGEFGLQATMDQVEPFQVRERYEFRWYGSESFKATQQVQQMISFTNVLRGIPPQLLNGRKVDIGPALEYISQTIYGPRLASHVLIDQRHQLSMSVPMENQMLHHGFPVQVHDMDNDMEHIQGHMAEFQQLMSAPPEIQGNIPEAIAVRTHILNHMKQMKDKAAMSAQGGPPGVPGTPGGAGPGIPGQPQPGAAAQMPTGPQQPPGAVTPDKMPMRMPRKSGA